MRTSGCRMISRMRYWPRPPAPTSPATCWLEGAVCASSPPPAAIKNARLSGHIESHVTPGVEILQPWPQRPRPRVHNEIIAGRAESPGKPGKIRQISVVIAFHPEPHLD